MGGGGGGGAGDTLVIPVVKMVYVPYGLLRHSWLLAEICRWPYPIFTTDNELICIHVLPKALNFEKITKI